MTQKKSLILSLGSNQGNRKENIEKAIDLIHQKIAPIEKTSSLYESPAWGFDGSVFYNCVLELKTNEIASNILKKILTIELEMGRVRISNGYQDRIIDIDIISYGEMIIENGNLTIPHPLMHKRKFVLLPLQEIKENWKHPALKKDVSELINFFEEDISLLPKKIFF